MEGFAIPAPFILLKQTPFLQKYEQINLKSKIPSYCLSGSKHRWIFSTRHFFFCLLNKKTIQKPRAVPSWASRGSKDINTRVIASEPIWTSLLLLLASRLLPTAGEVIFRSGQCVPVCARSRCSSASSAWFVYFASESLPVH